MKKMMCFTSITFLSTLLCALESQAQTWTSLGGGMDSFVWALAYDTNGNLYAGGDFTTAGGVAANYIAKWNGSSWTNLDSGMNTSVYALAIDTNGNLYAGGDFTTAGGVAANRIAKWNGSSWTNLDSGMDGMVSALAFDPSGNLYAAGGFNTAGGIAAFTIAKWNGANWTNFGNSGRAVGIFYTVACDSKGDIYAGGWNGGGSFPPLGLAAKWGGSNWVALGISDPNGEVTVLACDTCGNLYAGGFFTTLGGVAANHIAKWNGSGWSSLGSGMVGGDDACKVHGLAFDPSGNLYAGGFFGTAGGVTANCIAKWNGSGWSNLGSGMLSEVCSLVFDHYGNLYAGGLFNSSGDFSTNYHYTAKWAPQIVPDIRINNSSEITLHRGNQLSLAISLSASIGLAADWWLVAETPFGLYYYNASDCSWHSTSLADLNVSWQGYLFDFGALYEVINMNTAELPAGTYNFYFGVDTLQNGRLDFDVLYCRSAILNLAN